MLPASPVLSPPHSFPPITGLQGAQKPYNPIIGETFACYWKHADGSRSQYFAEQVLHRPPVSAIYFENTRHNVNAWAHVWTKSQFTPPQTVKSILEGACVLTLGNLGETYHMTFPTYYAHNLLVGTLRMEMGDTVHIVCEKTGLRADIDFHQLTLMGSADRLASVEGYIRRMPAGEAAAAKKTGGWFGGSKPAGEELFHITGHYTSVLNIAPVGSGTPEVLLDVTKVAVAPKWVLPLRLQGPWESRRLWQFATVELQKRPKVTWESVDREKGQLEEEQRMLPCHSFKSGGCLRGRRRRAGRRGGSRGWRCYKREQPFNHPPPLFPFPTAGEAGYVDWATKKFHPRSIVDPLSGTAKEYFVFDDVPKGPRKPDEPEPNLLHLSRTLADIRGGLGGAGEGCCVHTAPRCDAIGAVSSCVQAP